MNKGKRRRQKDGGTELSEERGRVEWKNCFGWEGRGPSSLINSYRAVSGENSSKNGKSLVRNLSHFSHTKFV